MSGIVTYTADVELMGWYSLSADSVNYELLSVQDFSNSVENQIQAVLHNRIWDYVDGRGIVFGEVESELIGILQPIADANGLYALTDDAGNEVDPGYAVVVDSTLNPVGSLAQNKIVAEVGIRPDPALATLVVNTYIASLTATLSS